MEMVKEKSTNVKVDKKPKNRRFDLIGYFKDVYAEMKKVVWPTWHQLLTYTGVVLVVVLGFAIVFGIIDLGLERIFRLIIS
ncbi:MAG: preprotein translocase subunit SecE [Clostridiales bacterium]|jgi:preprotein translocase subunit SecE|nr:preprotein translocase subunit SecE [Clostridiales bacterium]